MRIEDEITNATDAIEHVLSRCAGYVFNPFAILRAGYTHFERKIKRRSKYTHFDTLRHLFHCAEQSARYHLTSAEIDLLTDRIEALWSDYEQHAARMKTLQAEIEALGETLKAASALPKLNEHVSGGEPFQHGPPRRPDWSAGRVSLQTSTFALRRPQYPGAQKWLILRAESNLEEGSGSPTQGGWADDLYATSVHPYLRQLLP